MYRFEEARSKADFTGQEYRYIHAYAWVIHWKSSASRTDQSSVHKIRSHVETSHVIPERLACSVPVGFKHPREEEDLHCESRYCVETNDGDD